MLLVDPGADVIYILCINFMYFYACIICWFSIVLKTVFLMKEKY